MNYRGMVLRQGNVVFTSCEDTLTSAVHLCNQRAKKGDYIRILEVEEGVDGVETGQAVMFYRFTPDLVFK